MAQELSADDFLESTRQGGDGMYRVGHDGLDEDNDTPASPSAPADPFEPELPEDYPTTDTDVEPSEVYEEGEEGVAYSQKPPPDTT